MSKEKKKKKFPLSIIITVILSLIFGVCLGIFMPKYLDSTLENNEGELLSILLTFLLIYFTSIVQIIIHEAGHLVFGLLSGYRFSSFRIFNLMLQKENDKIKFKKFSLAGTGGQCIMVPPELSNGKIPVFLYNIGGCLMNIIASIICLILYIFFQNFSILSTTLLFMIFCGFLFALTNGIPIKTNLITNDGYNAISLRKNPDACKAFWLQLKINEQIAKGIRLKDMPNEWFIMPTDKQMKNEMLATIGVFACNRMMDEKRFEEADSLMAHLLTIDTSIAGIHKNLLVCDRMFIEMIHNNNKEVIEKMFTTEQKNFMKSMKNFPSVIRTEYVYALFVQNNLSKAESLKAQFEKVAKTYPYESDIQSEKELIEFAEKLVKT